jgi:hypothetical protein
LPVVQPTKFELAINLNVQRRSASKVSTLAVWTAATSPRSASKAVTSPSTSSAMASSGRSPISSLTFDDAALATINELRRHLHELEQVSGGLADGFQAFVGKLPGLAGSLALILHMASDPDDGAARPIPEEIAAKVHRLVVDFILPHAFEFYRSSTGGDQLRRLASFILTNRQMRIVSSDLTKNVADLRGLTLFEVNQRVSPLIAAGWLVPEEPKLGPWNRAWTCGPMCLRTLPSERVRRRPERPS